MEDLEIYSIFGEDLVKLCQNFPLLKKLRVKQKMNLNQTQIQRLNSHCPLLQHFIIPTLFSSTFLENFSAFRYLKTLLFPTNVPPITDSSIQVLVNGCNNLMGKENFCFD